MKLELFYPVKPLHINQIFGNPDPKYFQLGLKGHNGIDFMAAHGQPVYASHDGVVTVQTDSYQGHGVIVRTESTFDYNDGQAFFSTIYWHFINSIPVSDGQKVKAGDLLGFADSTGFSTGDHLHFGLKALGLNENGVLVNLEQNNGYLGAIDPKPYFNNLFADDIPKTSSTRLRILGNQYIALGNTKQGNIILAVARVVEAFSN